MPRCLPALNLRLPAFPDKGWSPASHPARGRLARASPGLVPMAVDLLGEVERAGRWWASAGYPKEEQWMLRSSILRPGR